MRLASHSFVQLRLHFIVLLWGFTGIVGKFITISAIPLVWYRLLFGLASMLLAMLLLKRSLKVSPKQLCQLLIVGFVIGLHWICFFASIKVSNVSVALSTLSVGAFFAILFEAIFYKRKIIIREVFFSLLVMVCLFVIFQVKPDFWLGIFLGLLASLLSAVFSVFNAKLQPLIASDKIIFYELIGGFVVVCIAVLLIDEGWDSLAIFSWWDFAFLLILGTILTVYPMIESVRLMKNMSPFTLLLTVNLEPIYGIILAFFIFKDSERMNIWFYLAALLMVSIIGLNSYCSYRDNRKKMIKPHESNS